MFVYAIFIDYMYGEGTAGSSLDRIYLSLELAYEYVNSLCLITSKSVQIMKCTVSDISDPLDSSYKTDVPTEIFYKLF